MDIEATHPELGEIITEDGILCSIISRLSLREAVRTSVLSRRWRHLWARLPKFKFDAANMLDPQSLRSLRSPSLLRRTIDQFIGSVNSVLEQHRGDRVEEISVEFFLNKIHSDHLDAWVRFAVAANTRKLSVYLEQPVSDFTIELYDFPCHLLGSSSIEELSLIHCSLKQSHGFHGLSFLEGLELYDVDITEEDINRLVSNCLNLKKLSLRNSKPWTTLRIPQTLSQLQTLVVRDCDKLRKIEINAMNLSKLCYWGLPANIIFCQSSQLEHADIRFCNEGRVVRNLDFYLTKLHRNLPHLRSLTFHIFGFSKVSDLRKESYTFSHLTNLDLTWNVYVKMSLLHLSTLLDAAPILEELKLHMPLSRHVREQPPQSLTKLREMLPKHPHTHLKTIEISEFYCEKWQIEIALYLLSNATELESMTIEKGCQSSTEIQERDMKNLSQEVPANVKYTNLATSKPPYKCIYQSIVMCLYSSIV